MLLWDMMEGGWCISANVLLPAFRKILLEDTDLAALGLSEQDLLNDLYPTLICPQVSILCDSCHNDVSLAIRIATHSQDYCPGCFAKLPVFPPYQVVSCLDVLLFDDDWRAAEELKLVEGIDKLGQDWQAIADLMDSDKQPQQISHHYNQLYLNAPHHLPQASLKDIIRVFDFQPDLNNEDSLFTTATPNEHPTHNKRRAKRRRQRQMFGRRTVRHQTGSLSIPGYYQKRGEFDEEYDDEAELLLADLQFEEDDTADLTALKFEVITVYNQRLRQRNQVKDFIHSKGLLDLQKLTNLQRDKNKKERDLEGMLKPFERFHSRQDHLTLIAGIASKLEKEQRLKELKEMKRKGIKRLPHNSDEEERPRQQDGWKIQTLLDLKKTRKGEAQANAKPVERPKRKRLNPSVTLEKRELALCQKWNIHPMSYLLIKETLMREQMLKGPQSKKTVCTMLKLSPQAVDELCRLLTRLSIHLTFRDE